MQFLVIGDSGSGKKSILQTFNDGSPTGIWIIIIVLYILFDRSKEWIYYKECNSKENNQKIILHIHDTTTTSYYKDAMVQNTSDY